MKWKAFVKAMILKEFQYIAALKVTNNVKNRLQWHLSELQFSLELAETKKFKLFLDYEKTLKDAQYQIDLHQKVLVDTDKPRRFKSNTQRKIDDHVEVMLKSIANRSKWYLSGTTAQRAAVISEVIS